MDRREMLGMLGAGAVGLAAMSGREAIAHEFAAADKECLEACADCARACDLAFHFCLSEVWEGKKEYAPPLEYFVSCADFCALSASNLTKHSPLIAFSCIACGDACNETLDVVSKFDAEQMKAAAQALARCEKSCKSMHHRIRIK
jgi:hypothetical protein